MKNLNSLLLAGALVCAATSWAVPAKRVQHTVTQPDGTQLTLTMVGDEYCHYFITDDSQAVVRSNGAYYFAKSGADGRLIASSVLASDAAARTSAQTAFLQSLKKDEISDAVMATRNLSPLKMSPVSRGVSSDDISGVGLISDRKTHPHTGNVRALVVMVEYADVRFRGSREEAYAYFNGMLNEEGFSQEGATGSAYDYFTKASDGKFTPQFDLAGPYTLKHNREYYGGNNVYDNDKNAIGMVEDMAAMMVAEGFDFKPYDNDNDGVVDNVFVFYAGVGEAQSGVEDAVWPHQYRLSAKYWPRKGYKVGDNLYLDSYACSSEMNDVAGVTLDGIGTFVHEYSHVLGLPDLYHTNQSNVTYTPNKYSVLDAGPYNNNSRTPPTYSAFERNALGWIDLIPIHPDMDIRLDNLEDSNSAYVITTDSPNEFFLFENRQKTGRWDAYLPGHGMLVWHIDYDEDTFTTNKVNNDPNHQRVDLIEAGGNTGVSAVYLRSYPYPGTMKKTSLEYPKIKTWAGADLGMPITEITETDGVIAAKVGSDKSGIASSAADSPLKVSVIGNTLTVSGVDAPSVSIYDSIGRIVSRGSATATLVPGIYVVATPEGSVKVSLR